jgi:hypothetical protein
MSNTSTTGGYLAPVSTAPIPGALTLNQFLQTVLVGISGYDPTLVRPKFQMDPPKPPDIGTDWIAFWVETSSIDANAYTGLDSMGIYSLQRHQLLSIQMSFYGPNSGDNLPAVIDGFQIQQNMDALRSANMGFRGSTNPIHAPELIGERWVDRWDATVEVPRQIIRTYPVLSFASVRGSIHTVLENNYSSNFNAGGP